MSSICSPIVQKNDENFLPSELCQKIHNLKFWAKHRIPETESDLLTFIKKIW